MVRQAKPHLTSLKKTLLTFSLAWMGAVVLPMPTQAQDLPEISPNLKKMLGADDSLDVFGVHGVGGIIGALGTGIFVSPALGGTGVYDYVANKVGEFDMMTQLTSQAWGVGVAIIWSAVVSFIAFKIVDLVIGLRVPEEEEREGLDTTSHGESAYHM